MSRHVAADQSGREGTSTDADWRAAAGVGAVLGAEIVLRDVLLPAHPDDAAIGLVVAGEWLTLGGLLVWWVPRVERRDLASVGVGPFRWRHVWQGGAAYLLTVGASAFTGKALAAVGLPSVRTLQPVIRRSHPATRVALFLTGTVLEEILYRGYLMERLIRLTGRPWLAGAVDWLAFSAAHLKFFGLGPTLDVGPLSVALVALYGKERTLWPGMVLHGLNDALAFIVAPLLPAAVLSGS